jgi:hypothetical protein
MNVTVFRHWHIKRMTIAQKRMRYVGTVSPCLSSANKAELERCGEEACKHRDDAFATSNRLRKLHCHKAALTTHRCILSTARVSSEFLLRSLQRPGLGLNIQKPTKTEIHQISRKFSLFPNASNKDTTPEAAAEDQRTRETQALRGMVEPECPKSRVRDRE